MEKPLILITNDDGITAPGIESLIEAASEFGEILVIAPDSPQSGMGHAITVNNPLRMDKSKLFKNIERRESTLSSKENYILSSLWINWK